MIIVRPWKPLLCFTPSLVFLFTIQSKLAKVVGDLYLKMF